MKTVIPCEAGAIAADFAKAQEFSIVSGSGWELSIETIQHPGGSVQELCAHLASLGIERVLAGGMDTDAIRAAENSGFQVFHGAGGSLSDGLNLIRLGILDNMVNGCGGGSCGSGSCGSGGCGSSSEEQGCGSGGCCSGR